MSLLLLSLSLISVGQVVRVPSSRYLSIKNLNPSCVSLQRDKLRKRIVITGVSPCQARLNVILRKTGRKQTLKINVVGKPIKSTVKQLKGWK